MTKYFYLKGWSGVNIEPIKEYYEHFKVSRPTDINLNMGISNQIETMKFYFIPKTGLSTFDKNIASQAKQMHFDNSQRFVRVTTLDSIFQKYHLKNITFLKIDVEGFEKQVLEGINLKKYRPMVFVIEAFLPNSHIAAYGDWQPILLNNHYRFVLSDGLNRYYLAEEHKEFLEGFKKAGNCAMAASKDNPGFGAVEFF